MIIISWDDQPINHHFRRGKYAGREASWKQCVLRLSPWLLGVTLHLSCEALESSSAPMGRSGVSLQSSWHFPNPPLNDWRVSEIVSEMKRIECRLLMAFTFRDNQRCWKRKHSPNIHGLSCFAKTNTFTKLLPRPHIYLLFRDTGVPSGYRRFRHPPDPTWDPTFVWRTPIPLPEKVRESSNSNLTSAINGVINGD